MDTDCLVTISIVVSAIATVAMAVTSYATLRLTRKISDEGQKYQQQFTDLLQAVVISSMTQMAGGFVSTGIAQFKQHYKGKTIIFE